MPKKNQKTQKRGARENSCQWLQHMWRHWCRGGVCGVDIKGIASGKFPALSRAAWVRAPFKSKISPHALSPDKRL